MYAKINDLLLIIFLFLVINNYGTVTEYENTWKRYTNYSYDSIIAGEYLYVNAYCALEVFHIADNGTLVLTDVIEPFGLIHGITFDEEDNMLYVLLAGYLESPNSVIAYRIINNSLEYCFTYDTGTIYLGDEWAFPVADYVIFGRSNANHYYDKISQSIEVLSYDFTCIICSYNDILVDYNEIEQQIYFYQIADIDNPELLSLFDIEFSIYNRVNYCVSSENLLFIAEMNNIHIFDIENNQNIQYLNTLVLPVRERIIKTISLEDDLLYINPNSGEKFIYDISNPLQPVPLYSWDDQGITPKACSIYNNRYLYTSNSIDGLCLSDLDELPEPELQTLKEFIPFFGNCFFKGLGYKNESAQFFQIDPESGEIEVICDLPIDIGWSYFTDGNYIYIIGTSDLQQYLSIIDIEVNQLIFHNIFENQIYTVHNRKIFVYENANTISIYELNTDHVLEFCSSIDISGSVRISKFDDIYIWLSDNNRDLLYNTETLEIEIDYGNVLSPNPGVLTVPYYYNNRLILEKIGSSDSVEISLYDISELDNPIFLDEKLEANRVQYFSLENYIIEIHLAGETVYAYERFNNSFTFPEQELDFNTCIIDFVVDEEHHRIGLSSPYYLKTFLYENTGNGLNLCPDSSTKLLCYPNPFNPETTISFALSDDLVNLSLKVYNVKGQLVKKLLDDRLDSGTHNIIWDGETEQGKRAASGVYFYQLKAGDMIKTRKMMLIK